MTTSLYRLYDFEELERVRIRENGASFKLKGISRTILIRAHWDLVTAKSQARDYEVKCNYVIQTPVQARPYLPLRIWAEDENQAILEYVTHMIEFYNQASQKHHYQPRDSWLRPVASYFAGSC